MTRIYVIGLLCAFVASVQSLECYVCEQQETNTDKCVKTLKTCDPEQDRCLSEIRWGSTPYWAPSGEKQYYISKSCADVKTCEDRIRTLSSRCDRIWYNDWECAECCPGNRCNYFVTVKTNWDQGKYYKVSSEGNGLNPLTFLEGYWSGSEKCAYFSLWLSGSYVKPSFWLMLFVICIMKLL